MSELNIFKISYQWYEDDHGETLLGKNISKGDFEKDLIEAKKFAESLLGIEIKGLSYLGRGYKIQCLPEYYEQVIWFLTEKKGYIICDVDEDVEYFVDDADSGKAIIINKKTQEIEWQQLSSHEKEERETKKQKV